MGTISIWHIAIVLIALSTIIPIARILKRVGLSGWWTIVYLIPCVGWFGLWVFAFARWPAVEPSSRAPASDA